jgi:DNA-directed RNA polymerase subunit F
LQKLGRNQEATRIFTGLMKHGEAQLQAREAADYFAKFGQKQSERARKAQAPGIH